MNFNINLTNFSKHIMEINNDNLIGTKRKFENEISKENSNPELENKRSNLIFKKTFLLTSPLSLLNTKKSNLNKSLLLYHFYKNRSLKVSIMTIWKTTDSSKSLKISRKSLRLSRILCLRYLYLLQAMEVLQKV